MERCIKRSNSPLVYVPEWRDGIGIILTEGFRMESGLDPCVLDEGLTFNALAFAQV